MGPKLGGIAVHIGARVAALATAGEILLSRTVKDLVARSGRPWPPHAQGVPGEWHLFALDPN